jgi:predicted ATPase
MATVHVREIQRWLRDSGQTDAAPGAGATFLEIRFDEPGEDVVADEEMRNKIITAESPQGSVTLVFDDSGLLRSLDIS